MTSTRAALGAAVVALVTLACGDSNGPNSSAGAEITVVAQPAKTDTASAKPLQALVVELRDAEGKLAPGRVVRFVGIVRPAQPNVSMLIGRVASDLFSTFAADTTDARGRASVRVQFGFGAGTGAIEISVPETGAADTLSFEVKPASLAGIRVTPHDTTVMSGTSITFTAKPVDRFENQRSDAVTFSLGASAAGLGALDATGRLTATGQFGRLTVRATAGTVADSANVGVFPRGTIVAWDRFDLSLVLIDLDGSHRQPLTPSGSMNSGEVEPGWSPDGRDVVYPVGGDLRITTVGGGTRDLFASRPAEIRYSLWPAYSPDGQWIYFGGEATAGTGVHIWRVRADGSGLEVVTNGTFDSRPSPSPDGRFLTYHTLASGQPTIRVMDLTTKALTPTAIRGVFPEWSPRGELIAYHDQFTSTINVMRPDGTGIRTVASAFLSHPLSWSPDGTLLITWPGGPPTIFEVATGIVMPLPQPVLLTDIAWRPTTP